MKAESHPDIVKLLISKGADVTLTVEDGNRKKLTPRELAPSFLSKLFQLSESDFSRQRVVLNVGGKRFETYPSIFKIAEGSLLSRMFAEENREMLHMDSNGEYFFDRSPLLFPAILDFYRTKKLFFPPEIPWEQVKTEILFWGIPVPIDRLAELHSSFRLGDFYKREAIMAAEGRVIGVLNDIFRRAIAEVSSGSEGSFYYYL